MAIASLLVLITATLPSFFFPSQNESINACSSLGLGEEFGVLPISKIGKEFGESSSPLLAVWSGQLIILGPLSLKQRECGHSGPESRSKQ